MKKTRLSFTYLIGYLVLGGAGLVMAPDFGFQLLGAKGSYPTPLVRLLGAFLLALAVIVIQIVRHRIESLYRTTLLVRLPLVVTTLALYTQTRDPVFLSLAAIVGVGMVLTTLGMVTDDRARFRKASQAQDAITRHDPGSIAPSVPGSSRASSSLLGSVKASGLARRFTKRP